MPGVQNSKSQSDGSEGAKGEIERRRASERVGLEETTIWTQLCSE
jgi:hypothetical protein